MEDNGFRLDWDPGRVARAGTVIAGGQPQSYVDLDDPGALAFEYVAHFGLVIDLLPSGPLAVTHIGGAGLSLPRYVAATRPGSPQIVFEPDTALTEFVRRELPLPRGHRIRVRPVGGREGLGSLAPASADVVVLDAYADGAVPVSLVTAEFFTEVARVLRPGGLLLANLGDEPGLRFVARVSAAAATALPEVAVVATHDVLKGRRYGNAVLVASGGELPDGLDRAIRRSPAPSGVMPASRLVGLMRAARPSTDTDPAHSPTAPDLGSWRLR